MNTSTKNLVLLPMLTASLGLMLAGRVTAQTFTTLYTFSARNSGTNSDGALPAGLIISDNGILFGTAGAGGSSGSGTVFALNTDGTGFTNLYSFSATSGLFPDTNSDGATPSPVTISTNTLYGTTVHGGSSGWGTVFAVNTDGTGFTNLYSFPATYGPYPQTNSEGAYPVADVVVSGNTL